MGKMPNGRVIGTAALGAVPVLIVQLVIAFISLAFKQKVGHNRDFLSCFVAFLHVPRDQCPNMLIILEVPCTCR